MPIQSVIDGGPSFSQSGASAANLGRNRLHFVRRKISRIPALHQDETRDDLVKLERGLADKKFDRGVSTDIPVSTKPRQRLVLEDGNRASTNPSNSGAAESRIGSTGSFPTKRIPNEFATRTSDGRRSDGAPLFEDRIEKIPPAQKKKEASNKTSYQTNHLPRR